MSTDSRAITTWFTFRRIVVIFVCGGALVGAFAVLVIMATYRHIQNSYDANARLRLLENEFTSITPLARASRLRYESSHKGALGSVNADYDTADSYSDIRKHYDQELRKNGWTFAREKPVTIWRRDYGGRELFYCKDHNTAVIEYAGNWKDAGWTYTFSMSWGLFEECG
jgi:hypothetical protein